jgi:hypothetical protein
LIGALAAALLVLNINLPHVIEALCSIAIVWVNLAYLLVTLPMLVARLRRRNRPVPRGPDEPGLFSMGRLGLPVNAIAVAWGCLVVLNIGWPRPEIYGSDRWGRFAAPLATLTLLIVGAVYYGLVQRHRTGILAEHAARKVVNGQSASSGQWSAVNGQWSVISMQ